MSRRRFMGSPSSLNPIIAPDNFDPEAQNVNLYKIYSEYLNKNKAYGYTVADANNITLNDGSGVSYYYGYTRSGVDYTFTVNSGTNIFSAGDTKRFVIVNNGTISLNVQLPTGAQWLIIGNRVNYFHGAGTTLKYVHYIGNSGLKYFVTNVYQNNTTLTGTLTIPPSMISVQAGSFVNSTGINKIVINSQNTSFIDNPFYKSNIVMNDQIGGNWEIYDNILYNDITRTSICGTSKVKSGNLVIPNTVTTIGKNAFRENILLNGSVVIPDSVTLIDEYAFNLCTGFNGNLTLGNSVVTIGIYAFATCNKFIGSLVIPDSVTSIGYAAFGECASFNGNLTLGNSVVTIGGFAFNGCNKFIGNLIIPNSTTTIGDCAFQKCTGFNGNLTLGNSVVTIGYYAFYQCTGFNGNLTLGNSVITIGLRAFYQCTNLTGGLTIPNTVTTIGDYAFYQCTDLNGNLVISNTSITFGLNPFGGTNLIMNEQNGINWEIYDNILYNDITRTSLNGTSLVKSGNLVIPNTVTSIGNNAFIYNTNLTGNLTIPDSVITIGNYAFHQCSGFNGALTIGNSVTTIGTYAFYQCTGLIGNLTIPDSVTTIGDVCFYGCTSFNGTLTLGNSLTIISLESFRGCSNLTGNLIIPNTVTTIEDYAFYGCSNLNGNLTIPNTTTITFGINPFVYTNLIMNDQIGGNWEIYDNVLYKDITRKVICGTSKVKSGSLVIPNTVTSIGNYAFRGNTNLNGDLTIGTSVLGIGEYAFFECSGFIGALNMNCLTPNIQTSVFYLCNGFTALNLASGYNPSTNVTYYNYTFNFSSIFTTSSLNQSIINITSGTKTFYIGTTNKNRLLADFPNAVSDALARGITVV